ncbi:MAG: peptidoglycan DD-metalloendopeptidase family protein [Cyanobacteria bacterium P01_G01_bin.38]
MTRNVLRWRNIFAIVPILLLPLILLTALTVVAPAANAEQLYDLPFKGEDLRPGERYSRGKRIHTPDPNHVQHWGYDLGANRWDSKNDRWTSVFGSPTDHWNDPKNTNYVVYGKPVYAIADGVVTKCWRNAPDNPRPKLPSESKNDIEFSDREWLHPEFRNNRMAFGGNFLQMTLSDGSSVRYSHMVPGSIPTNLCPHNDALWSAPGRSEETEVPETQQATVQRGQLLGKVGNNGNSTGPHLHFHREKDGKPSKIEFRRGLATPVTGDQANIDNWKRFAGDQISPGPTLIWPPRTVGQEYARHRFPEKDFGRMYDHLADSGYWPKWIDGYSVNGKVFYNFVWTKAPGQWRGYFGQTSAQYQKRINDAKRDGFAPVFVESYLRNGQTRYAVVFQKGKAGQWRARHNLTVAQHQVVLDQAKQDGLKPVNVSVVSVNGQRRYTVLYRSDSIGSWQLKSQILESDYQRIFDENKQAGRRPIYLNAYVHDGRPYLAAIFSSKPKGAASARHRLSSSGYQSAYSSATRKGLLTQAVTSFDGARTQHRYAAVWNAP